MISRRKLLKHSLLSIFLMRVQHVFAGPYFAFWKDSTPPAAVLTDSATNASGLTNYSFTSTNLGTASPDRKIVVAVGVRHTTARTINTVTIAGVTATTLVELTGSGQQSCGLYIAAVPTGATGTIDVALSGAASRAGIGVWAVTGLDSTTPTFTGSTTNTTTTSTTIDVDEGGIIIAANYGVGSSSGTWTNLTEDYDLALTGPNSFSGASSSFATAQTVTVTRSQASDTSTSQVAAALR